MFLTGSQSVVSLVSNTTETLIYFGKFGATMQDTFTTIVSILDRLFFANK
jgi:hypothetical protein